MFAFASMLIPAAKKAGISVPRDPEKYVESRERHPHFFVFCIAQLGRSMRPGEQFENAKIIAKIPKNKIRLVSLNDLLAMGIHWQQ